MFEKVKDLVWWILDDLLECSSGSFGVVEDVGVVYKNFEFYYGFIDVVFFGFDESGFMFGFICCYNIYF